MAMREISTRWRKLHGKVFHRKAVKEGSGKLPRAIAHPLMSKHEVDGKGGDELEMKEGSRKGLSPQAVKERSGKLQKASATYVAVLSWISELMISR